MHSNENVLDIDGLPTANYTCGVWTQRADNLENRKSRRLVSAIKFAHSAIF